MKIALKCEKCGHIFHSGEEDTCLEIDFKDQKISYVCRNKECRHDNVLDLSNWKKQQKHSPLPRIGIM